MAILGAALMDAGGVTKVKPPPERDYASELTRTLSGQEFVAPRVLNLEQQYRPEFARLSGQDLATAVRGYKQTFGTDPLLAAMKEKALAPEFSALERELYKQAQGDLAAGAELDPSLRHEVEQSIRAGQASRGLGYGPGDALAEGYAVGDRARQMRNERRAYASNVEQLMQSKQNMNRQFLLDTGRFRTSDTAAIFSALGKGGPALFDPQSSYAQDLYNTNYNADAAARIATANNRAGLYGGSMSADASVAGSAGSYM